MEKRNVLFGRLLRISIKNVYLGYLKNVCYKGLLNCLIVNIIEKNVF